MYYQLNSRNDHVSIHIHVALYDEAQTLPLPVMYGKKLIFKTGGVDGCDCREILDLCVDYEILCKQENFAFDKFKK